MVNTNGCRAVRNVDVSSQRSAIHVRLATAGNGTSECTVAAILLRISANEFWPHTWYSSGGGGPVVARNEYARRSHS